MESMREAVHLYEDMTYNKSVRLSRPNESRFVTISTDWIRKVNCKVVSL